MEAVQAAVFFALVAAVVLAAAACIGETAKAREDAKALAARVAALENELLRLHVPRAAKEEPDARRGQSAPARRQAQAAEAAAPRPRPARIHYELGHDGMRRKEA